MLKNLLINKYKQGEKMTQITLHGKVFNTLGELPQVGETAPSFTLLKNDLSEVTLDNYQGKRKIISVFPSLDTPVCATSVRNFNKVSSELNNVVVLNVSMDLPFAQGRFCVAEGIDKVDVLSAFRSSFSNDYNLEIIDGLLQGLCSRVIIVIDENNKILYTEQIKEIAEEPNYKAALAVLK